MKLPNLRAGVWLLAVLVALAGCVTTGADKSADAAKKKKYKTLWPAPPEQPRFAYEATLRSAADIIIETDDMKWEKMLTGRGISDKPVIDKPSGIAVRNGLVYVPEPTVKAITVFDIPRRKLFRFGLREPNVLDKPLSIALDGESRVYVLDSGLKKVMVFDKLGLFEYSIPVNKGFTYPVAVAASPDGKTIYVVDRGDVGNADHKVVALSPDGKELFRLGPRGKEEGKFNIPLAATVAPDGALFVVDSGNFRIQKFDAQGKFLMAFGGVGAEFGKFSRPRSVALDAEGNIYVADAGFGNVQVFNAAGQLLMPLGGLSREPGPANYPLIASIAVDETNRLYVIDHYFKKIEVFRRLSDEEGKQRMSLRN